MRVEFNQGVPEGCTQWLRENVGPGNVVVEGERHQQWNIDDPKYAWFYERIEKPIPGELNGGLHYVPTITVKDEKLATLFALKWSK